MKDRDARLTKLERQAEPDTRATHRLVIYDPAVGLPAVGPAIYLPDNGRDKPEAS
jgi:hypothetical protein